MDSTLRQAAEEMQNCDCGAIPVVESTETMRLLGIITDRDIAIRAVAKGLDPNSTRVAECMSENISFVKPDSTLSEVERIMENLQVRRVPVVNENRSICGMVSMADIALVRPSQNAGSVVQEVSKPTHAMEHAAYLS
jgi:CBS domain-containing protein